ncbi:MAG: hypothetical protein AAB576_04700, partial [Elusimicrobiota bacterium]
MTKATTSSVLKRASLPAALLLLGGVVWGQEAFFLSMAGAPAMLELRSAASMPGLQGALVIPPPALRGVILV